MLDCFVLVGMKQGTAFNLLPLFSTRAGWKTKVPASKDHGEKYSMGGRVERVKDALVCLLFHTQKRTLATSQHLGVMLDSQILVAALLDSGVPFQITSWLCEMSVMTWWLQNQYIPIKCFTLDKNGFFLEHVR